MSGRKSSEVYSVLHRVTGGLEQNVRARKANIEKYKQQEKYFTSTIGDIKLWVQNLSTPEVTAANKRFAREVTQKSTKLQQLQQLMAQSKTAAWKSNFQVCVAEIDKIKKQAKIIRESVRGHDYNNSQYNEAVRLEQRLNQTMHAIQGEERSYLGRIESLQINSSQLQQQQTEAKGLLEELQKLEEQAKFLDEREREANSLRVAIKEKLNDFDKAVLEYFHPMEILKNKYAQKEKELLNFSKQSDEAVIKNFATQAQSLAELQSYIGVQYQIYVQQQKELAKGIEDFNKQLTEKKYINCMTGEENIYAIAEFIQEYGSPINLQEIKEILQEIISSAAEHLFTDGLEKLKKLNEKYHKVHDQAIEQQERIQSTFSATKKARDAMSKLSYNTHIEYVKNEKVYDGLKLTASYGDDVIHFTAEYSDDGQFKTFAINHLDKNGNDAIGCERSWGEIRDAMADQGFCINQIYKKGRPVIPEKKQAVGHTQNKSTKKASTK